MQRYFRKIAHFASRMAGSPWTFLIAVIAVILWAVSGFFFDFSTTWQLIINTGTTILTFLMVFLIQNTQNRDSHAVHLKLDELIWAVKKARNDLIDIEDADDDKLEALEREFERLKTLHPELRQKPDASGKRQ